jgi:hypothetical protein
LHIVELLVAFVVNVLLINPGVIGPGDASSRVYVEDPLKKGHVGFGYSYFHGNSSIVEQRDAIGRFFKKMNKVLTEVIRTVKVA